MRSLRSARVLLPWLVCLPSLANAAGIIVTGTDEGTIPHVRVFDGETFAEQMSFLPYGGAFTGGVRVAAGDVNGDLTPDIITGAGPGGFGHVKAFDGASGAEIRSFFAYGPSFSGGLFVGSGDVDDDGWDDIVTGVDTGFAPHVKVFSGQTGSELASFFAYGAGFMGGVRVAAGDLTGDGHADLFTGSGPGAPHVKVFNGVGGAEVRSFLAYPSVGGGVFVAAGDVSGDGLADIVTGIDEGFASHVKVFDAVTNAELRSFIAYGPSFSGGVRVGSADLDGDGRAEIVTGTGPSAAHVKVFDGLTGAEAGSFLPYPGYSGGVFVAAAVPEPGMLATLGLGVVLVLRRRNR